MWNILKLSSLPVSDLPTEHDDYRTPLKWHFLEQLPSKDDAFFVALIVNHPLILLEYKTQCAHIVNLINQEPLNFKAIIHATEDTLIMAEVLDQIFSRFDEKSDLSSLRSEKEVFQAINRRYNLLKPPQIWDPTLNQFNPQFSLILNHSFIPWQIFSRTRRLILSAPLLNELIELRTWIEPFEIIIDPIYLHLNWIFFVPRLTVNLALIFKHVIPNLLMSQTDGGLPWRTQLHIQLHINQRWKELIYDFVWLIGNLINCFLLTGIWLPAEVYLTIGLQLFDLLFTCICVSIKLSQLCEIEKQCLIFSENNIANSHYCALQQQIALEKKLDYILIVNHLLLLLTTATILPIIINFYALSPILGAFGAIVTLISSVILQETIERNRPGQNVVSLIKQRFLEPSLPPSLT